MSQLLGWSSGSLKIQAVSLEEQVASNGRLNQPSRTLLDCGELLNSVVEYLSQTLMCSRLLNVTWRRILQTVIRRQTLQTVIRRRMLLRCRCS